MRILILILLSAAIMSCTTQKGVLNYMHEHPALAEEFCARNYPPVVENMKGDTVYVKSGNVDYSADIDSLNDQLTYARGLLEMYAKNAPDTCAYLVAAYEKEINSMSLQIKSLRDRYKPCKPDTIRIRETITVVDSALKGVNARLEERLSVSEENSKKKTYAIIGLSMLLAGSLYFNLRRFIGV